MPATTLFPPVLILFKAWASESPPRIQNMSNPRSASTETTRRVSGVCAIGPLLGAGAVEFMGRLSHVAERQAMIGEA